MEKEMMIKAGKDLLYIVGCVAKGIEADAGRIETMNLKEVYLVAKKHSMSAMSYLAVEKYLSENAEQYKELLPRWKDCKEKAVYRDLYLELGKENLISFLEERSIPYMPLKGTILKHLYPKSWCREMADMDIWFDKKHRKELRKFMESKGYEVESYGVGMHDTYMKPPVQNYEMHVMLFSRGISEAWEQYNEIILERIVKDSNNSSGYHFTTEDFYIYNMAHSFKHFDGSGTGIRILVDTYILMKNYGNTMDWDFVEKELKCIGVDKYEGYIRNISMKLFESEEALTPEESEILNFLISCGTYGSFDRSITRHMDRAMEAIQGNNEKNGKKSKFRYLLGRIFPDMELYKDQHPFIYKTKIFIPFFYLYRIVKGFITRGKYIWTELKLLWKRK